MPPSSREALRGLLSVLERCGYEHFEDETACGLCGSPVAFCDTNDPSPDERCYGRDVRAALTAWTERERLKNDDAFKNTLRINFGQHTDIAAAGIDAHLFGTPTSGDTPTDGEAGNPQAEVHARGSDLSPSSVTPRACEPWCGTRSPASHAAGWYRRRYHGSEGFCSPACRDAGRSLAPVGGKLEPMRGEVAEDVHETAGERNAREALEPEDAPSLAHAHPPAEVPEALRSKTPEELAKVPRLTDEQIAWALEQGSHDKMRAMDPGGYHNDATCSVCARRRAHEPTTAPPVEDVPKSAAEVPEEKCGTCGGRGWTYAVHNVARPSGRCQTCGGRGRTTRGGT